MDDLVILSRFVHFAALSLLFGGSLFRLCIQPQADQRHGWSRTIDIVAVIAAVLSAFGWFAGVGASMAGGWSEVAEADIMAAVLVETRFGRIWMGRLALIIAIIGLMFAWRRRTRSWEMAMLVLSGLLTASLAGVGHGSVGTGWLGPAHLAADMTHLLCAATWLGGLVCLWLVLRRAIMGSDPASFEVVRTVLPRFSRVGYVAVALLLLTGCINAIVLLARPEDFIRTDYGRVLFAKLGLVAVMVGIAIYNRLRLSPRILAASTPGRASVAALYRSIAVEQVVGIIVLAATAVLGTIHPVP